MTRRTLLTILSALFFTACAGMLLREPLKVSVAGIEPLPGQGMEARFAVQLRIQNPNDTPLAYDGIALDLDLRGMRFASGVSDQRGVVPRFGESLVTVPVTVPATALLRQAFGLANGTHNKVDYRLRGRLGGSGYGGMGFEASGEILPPVGVTTRGR